MRLRTFLMRRAVHTVITLLIVLVLLFVIFRLMPGNPARLFIRPGQTQADTDNLLVEFGFKHREPAPGHGFRGSFETQDEGTYEVALSASDSLGRAQAFHYAYTKQVSLESSPTVLVGTVGTGRPVWEPSQVRPNESFVLAAALILAPTGAYNVTIEALRGGTSLWFDNRTAVSGSPPNVTATWPPSQEGAYSVVVTFTGGAGKSFVGFTGVAVNVPDPSPFHLPADEWGLRTEPTSERFDRAAMHINVTSDGATIASVSAVVQPPRGPSLPPFGMFHPLIAVDNNLLEEFWTYMTNMLQGNFGKSLYSRQDVWYEISIRAGPTLLLFGSAVVISYTLGILIGSILAWRRGSKMELSSIVVSLFFYSMPVFWFGLILIWVFAFSLNLFPLGGYADKAAADAGGLTFAGNVLWHMALPLLNLVILSLAGHLLLMRNSMLEVMGEDYITTAKAKGLSERRIMYYHAARNALLPVVTAFALAISGVISGGVLTETIFSWPGMGAFLVTSTLNQDFPSVQGAFYLLAILTIVANLIADVLYAFLDPRVRL